MEYNTEVINETALMLAEMLKSAVQSEQKSKNGTVKIAEIETGIREALLQVGNQALSNLLSSLQPIPVAEIKCECGGLLHFQRVREATVISVFGKTTYKRAYYAGCTCKQGKAPVDEEFGLEPGAVTAGLATLLASAGIEYAYDKSPNWLQNFLLFTVSENTVRSETEQMGKLQEEQEKTLIEQSQNESFLQERMRNPGEIPTRLYGSIDAAKVRIEPRPKKGEEQEEHEDWRDMKVLCWFQTENVPPRQRSSRQKKKFDREQVALRAKNKQYFCDIAEASSFGKLLWATGCPVNADLCPDLVFLGDGATWIWNLVDEYYSHARQIVDWYHAEEHLETVAMNAFSGQQEQVCWLAKTTQFLWDGQVEDVIAACEVLGQSCLVAKKAVTYFTNNCERMRYDQFRAAGYMIGSGTIESACKQIVTHRLKLPGAQWTVAGAVQTAKARAAWLSDSSQWQSLCNLRGTLPLAA
jgi:hypothetical protein